jgi:hypothetical protein
MEVSVIRAAARSGPTRSAKDAACLSCPKAAAVIKKKRLETTRFLVKSLLRISFFIRMRAHPSGVF